MGLFWKRKSKDQFVTLGLNEPLANESSTQLPHPPSQPPLPQTQGIAETERRVPQTFDVVTAGEPAISETTATVVKEVQAPERLAPPRSPFATSVLGLNLTMEELQAQEAALEQELSARFRRAVAATRESLSEKLDTVFQGRKQIDEVLLEELEEALIATDIGVPTTLEILETVRREVARKQINDIEALKQAIKVELLKILEASERRGVASETAVPDHVTPYVMMIVGVNGVGKTTTIG